MISEFSAPIHVRFEIMENDYKHSYLCTASIEI